MSKPLLRKTALKRDYCDDCGKLRLLVKEQGRWLCAYHRKGCP